MKTDHKTLIQGYKMFWLSGIYTHKFDLEKVINMLKPLIHLQSYNIHIYPHNNDTELYFYVNIYQLKISELRKKSEIFILKCRDNTA